MMPVMIFSSKVGSSSSSPARAAFEANRRPTPSAIADNRAARVSVLGSIKQAASVLRIASTRPKDRSFCSARDQGAFAAPVP